MKKHIALVSFFILLISCNKEETFVLNEKIKSLEIENQKLKDSISNMAENELFSMQLVGLPNYYIFKKNEENEVTFFFHKVGKIGTYQVFRIDEDGKREVLVPEANETKFTYKFTPTSVGEQELKLYAEFQLENQRLEFPAYFNFKVEE